MGKLLRRGIALCAASIMTLSLMACGNNSTESNTTETKENVTAETKETEKTSAETKNEPVTLKFAWWGGQARHDYTQKLLDKYTELHPNVTFEAIPSGWDGYFDKLATQAASGSMPDIVQMDYLYISTYAKNNSVADLQEFIDNGIIDVSNIDANLLNSGKIDGKMAGMVVSNSILAYGYNPDVFAEAGVDVPTADWTWDDFKTIAKTIKEKTGKYGYSAIMADDTNKFHYYVRQHGKSLFSDDNKSLGYDDDQIYIDFVNMMSELIEAGAMPNPDEYEQIKGLGHEGGPVVTGDGAIVQDWSNYAARVESVNDKIGLVTPPYGNDGTKGLWVKPGMFLSIAESSAHKQEAAEFIDWFINSEEANAIILGERGVPVSSKVREYLSSSGLLSQKQVEMFDYTDMAIEHCGDTPKPDPAGITEVNEAFKSSVYSVLYDQMSVEEAAKSFRETANEILARNN